MFSSVAQPEYERRLSHPNSFGFPHRPIELPHPVEPRPSHLLQSSLSEAAVPKRRQEAFHGVAHPTSDARQADGRQSLPGLRDILTPGPSISSQSSQHTAWNPPPATTGNQPSVEAYYRQSGIHPPLALHPPPDPGTSYHTNPVRRLELPILETSPISVQPSHSVPASPFTGYPDSRDYTEVRQERPHPLSTPSYLANGVPNPYRAQGLDESHYRSAPPSIDRQTGQIIPPAALDSQKKYLGVKEIPGEGTFHVYEGGTRLPTHVDGEQVNPAWGLTKANKPRKRLALACLDCREKKIKCEPGANSCLQCEKAKRPCRRAPIHQTPPDPPTASSLSGNASSPIRKGVSDPTPSGSRDAQFDLSSKRRTREDPSPPNVPTKKHRSASPVIGGGLASSERVVAVDPPPSAGIPPGPRSKSLAWEEDPYSVDPETTLHLLDVFFMHVHYSIYPRSAFLHWLQNQTRKCQNECMVLYAMLALASVYADDSLSGFGKRCADIATEAIATKTGRLHLCVVQTRLWLALYTFARGQNGASWDHSGLAIRAVTHPSLRMNTEQGCKDDTDSLSHPNIEFEMSREQLVECKRRTFWSCFLMDRYCRGTHCVINIADVFLRLPCTEEEYERSQPSEAPHFNNGIIDPVLTILTPSSKIASMGWLVLAAAHWGDVMNFNYRAVHRPNSTYRDAYEKFYADAHTAFQGWVTRLPEHLQYNHANLERSIRDGYGGTFISMHALYHFALMKLNRCVRHSAMMDLVPRNIRAAHYHAHTLLSIMKDLQTARRDTIYPLTGRITQFVFATPFPGYTTMSAIDIVGAGGLDSNLGSTIEVIKGGLECLRELSQYWNSARDQLKEAENRFYQIQNIVSRPYKSPGGAWLGREWGMMASLDREFGPEDDCIYGITDDGSYSKCYFDALKEDDNHRRASSGGLRIA